MNTLAEMMADRTPLAQRKEFMEKATELKNQGNEHYRKVLEECKKPVDQHDKSVIQTSLKEAKRFYHLARLQVHGVYPFNPANYKQQPATGESAALEKECFDLTASIYNNLAAVILAAPEGQKKSDYERAAGYCSNALIIQPDNSKAMYRKAQALEKLGDLKRAFSFYQDADLAEKHKNSAIQRDMARMKSALAETSKQAKEELKDNIQRGFANSGISLSSDAVQYGKHDDEKKKKSQVRKRYAESPSRGSSCTSSSSARSDSSSSGRTSDEE